MRNNLAHAFEEVDRLDEANDLFEKTLADSERLLGPEHLVTLTTRSNLVSSNMLRVASARPSQCLSRCLSAPSSSLGADHPRTPNVAGPPGHGQTATASDQEPSH